MPHRDCMLVSKASPARFQAIRAACRMITALCERTPVAAATRRAATIVRAAGRLWPNARIEKIRLARSHLRRRSSSDPTERRRNPCQSKPAPGSALRPARCARGRPHGGSGSAARARRTARPAIRIAPLERLAFQAFEFDADRIVVAVVAAAPGGGAGVPGALVAARRTASSAPSRRTKKWADTSRPRKVAKYGCASQSSRLVKSSCTSSPP